MKTAAVAMTCVAVQALHEWPHSKDDAAGCVAPGTCTPPATKYQRVIRGPQPGQQWNIDGGFCGAFSTQQCGLSAGAYVSQDLVRKANRDQTGVEHFMHGDKNVGYEVVPINSGYTAAQLKFEYEEWDFTSPVPQADAYKAWLKSHLSKGDCVVWFPICKGDGHNCYPGSCPGKPSGEIDHVEPMFGLFSNHPLDDPVVYPDDYILHASDQDLLPYYRPMSSLQDGLAMTGNCLKAQPGFGKNEMYPCFDEQVTYGTAIKGLNVTGSLQVALEIDITEEPDVRQGAKPIQVHGTVTVSGLTAGNTYNLFRYNATSLLPSAPPFAPNAQYTVGFKATADIWSYEDPNTFASDSAVYYLASATS